MKVELGLHSPSLIGHLFPQWLLSPQSPRGQKLQKDFVVWRPRWLAMEPCISGLNPHYATECVGWVRHFISWGPCFPPPLPSPIHSSCFSRSLPALSRPSFLKGEVSEGFSVPRPHRQLEGKCPRHKDLWGLAALGGALSLKDEPWALEGELQGLRS